MKQKSVLMYSVVFTILMVALIIFVYNFSVPNPNMILIAALVLSTSVGGAVPGLICAILMMGYSLFFFSIDHSWIHFTEENTHKIIVIALGVVINYLSVAFLKRNRDRAGNELRETNEKLEKTNEAYALAKISGLKYCEFLNRQYGTDYISVMPTNLYGPNDNYHPEHSHVLPALIRRFHEAKVAGLESVTCWGDGSPLREFLYVDDLANLCVFLMNNYSGNETVNAGTGKELTIKALTELVAKVVDYKGRIEWDTTRPNGTPRKLLDVSKATELGWTYKTELEDGIRLAYEDFLHNPMRAER